MQKQLSKRSEEHITSFATVAQVILYTFLRDIADTLFNVSSELLKTGIVISDMNFSSKYFKKYWHIHLSTTDETFKYTIDRFYKITTLRIKKYLLDISIL